MREMKFLACLTAVTVITGCNNEARMEPQPQQTAPRLGLADPQSQAVLVPEPATNDAGYQEPYATRSWGTDPIQPSPTAVMNLDRPEPTPTVPPQTAPPAFEPTPVPVEMPSLHIVRKGDTLWSIAEQHYGNGNRYRDILAANPDIVPEKLAVGETLVLP